MSEAKLVYGKRLVEQVATRPERRRNFPCQSPVEEAKHADYAEAGAWKRPRDDIGREESNVDPTVTRGLRCYAQRHGRYIDAKRGGAARVIHSTRLSSECQQIGARPTGEIERGV